MISPSKARHAAAQAKDWDYVDSWLTTKYHPERVPRFERNADTLEALLGLANANVAADRQAELMQRAQEEEKVVMRQCEAMASSSSCPLRRLIDQTLVALSPEAQRNLDDIAAASVLLGASSTDPVDLGCRTMQLTRREHDAANLLDRVARLQKSLEAEMQLLRKRLEGARQKAKDEVSVREYLRQQTTAAICETRQIEIKLREYKDRKALLDRANPSPITLQAVRNLESDVKNHQRQLEASRKQLDGYHALPPDLSNAKDALESARTHLIELQRSRDSAFENLFQKV